ncbi:MAG: tetratricopeptide repeat protein [Bacteroidetes bacterium]|nr:tetratricopeptide repeat protein [Bacteroidota bacterium]
MKNKTHPEITISDKNLFFIMVMFANLCMPAAGVYAQKQGWERVDSLKRELLNHPADDTAKVKLMYQISFIDHSIAPVDGIEYGEKALALAESLDYTDGIIWSLLCTGNCYWKLPNLPKALEYFIRALEISEKFGKEQFIAISNNNIGNVYADKEDRDDALKYYLKALAANEKLNSKIRVARNLSNIGSIYTDKKDFSRALDFHTRALKLYEELGEKRGLSITLVNIGVICVATGDYDQALEHFNRAVQVAEEAGEESGLMNAYGNIGYLYYKIATDTHHDNIVRAYLPEEVRNDYLKKSVDYSTMAFRLGKKIPAMTEIIGWSRNIADASVVLKNYEQAYRYLDSSRYYSDSVYSLEKTKIINSLKNRLEMDQKDAEIRIAKVKFEKANIQRFALAVGFVLLIIIVFLVYRDRRKSERVLLNILPGKIARRLKNRERPIAERFDDAAVVFIDIAEFTSFSMHREPDYVVGLLTDFFTKMDHLAEKHGMEKIKTIGDCYMAVSGLPEPVPDSLERAARFAIEARDLMRTYTTYDGHEIRVRIGIDAGKVVAGVIGEKKFSYDLWGDVVNTASRMESHGIVGEIQVTENVFHRLKGQFIMKERGECDIKGKGRMKTWILEN